MQGAARLCRNDVRSGGRSLLGRVSPCCRRHERVRILPWPPGNPSISAWLAASAESPALRRRRAARRLRTSQGGHVPGSYSAPRARALLASQRAVPQLVPDPALLIGDEFVARPPLDGRACSTRWAGEANGPQGGPVVRRGGRVAVRGLLTGRGSLDRGCKRRANERRITGRYRPSQRVAAGRETPCKSAYAITRRRPPRRSENQLF